MSISTLFQSIKRLFQPTVVPQAAAVTQPVATTAPPRPRPGRSDKPRATRSRQKWLDPQIEKINGSGKYWIKPPKDMDLEMAQCRVTARLSTKFGRGTYTTKQVKAIHMIHVSVA